MSGIVGLVSHSPANQQVYDALGLLQHRGQDSTGIATLDGPHIYIRKGKGRVRDAYRTRDMRSLEGTVGLGQVRNAAPGERRSELEDSPFYVNAPYGIVLAHSGTVNNGRELAAELRDADLRHSNTTSDSELLLNVLAAELQRRVVPGPVQPDAVFQAVESVLQRVRGAFAAIALIANFGLLAFRDPYGIRPLCLGRRDAGGLDEWMVATESVALTASGFELVRDVAPGEAVLIDASGQLLTHQAHPAPQLVPCAFEYVYLARPDSVMNGVSVYESRLRMGDFLAETIRREVPTGDIDVIMPIPDSARPAAMEAAKRLGIEYREGYYKNRYVGRTFIMPGQDARQKSVREKLNALESEFRGKRVLVVDDSVVRGTTSREIVAMTRNVGAASVTFTSAAPPVRYPNVYGINMPTNSELIAAGRSVAEVGDAIGADGMVFQELDDLRRAILGAGSAELADLELSCFDGRYVTGVSQEYLEWVARTQRS